MTHTKLQPQFEHVGSLITYRDGDSDRCLGYLAHFEGHGVFDPSFGKVNVSEQDAETHNKLLDEAMLKGLDENCEIGMHGSFYLGKVDGRLAIKTFVGATVSNEVERHGSSVSFRRNGKTFRGQASDEHDLLNFRRVA